MEVMAGLRLERLLRVFMLEMFEEMVGIVGGIEISVLSLSIVLSVVVVDSSGPSDHLLLRSRGG